MCKLEGHSWKESFSELNDKFMTTLILELAIWPGVQALNFYYVPPPLRLIYLNGAYLVWSIILSYLKHNVSHKSFPHKYYISREEHTHVSCGKVAS